MRKSVGSPTKSPLKKSVTTVVRTQQVVSDDIQEVHHSLQMNVSEKEIEIERLKTTVVSLNHKVAIVDDHA